MATEMITLKLEDEFLGEIDKIVKKKGYKNRTEFLRRAIREKVEEEELREAKVQIWKLIGASKKKVTQEEFESMREEAIKKLDKKLKSNPQA